MWPSGGTNEEPHIQFLWCFICAHASSNKPQILIGCPCRRPDPKCRRPKHNVFRSIKVYCTQTKGKQKAVETQQVRWKHRRQVLWMQQEKTTAELSGAGSGAPVSFLPRWAYNESNRERTGWHRCTGNPGPWHRYLFPWLKGKAHSH